MEWYAKISKVYNGYIVEYHGGEDLEPEPISVYQQRDDDLDGLEAVQDMLYEIMGHFGLSGSKHDPRRLVIEIRDQRPEE